MAPDGKVEIVVTPRCDLANAGKMEAIQLATCKDISQEWTGLTDPNTQSKTKQDKVKQYQQHDRKSVQHFLPRMRKSNEMSLGPWLVRFDRIRSVRVT